MDFVEIRRVISRDYVSRCQWACWFLALTVFGALSIDAQIWTVRYPASTAAGELDVPATFHLWLPPKVGRIRAVIVHQHGCGDGAERSGEAAALDLHWQALATRHHAALLSPHYHAGDGADCRRWCDPRRGSGVVFENALVDLARDSGHPELATAPWCLWGHSGGGFWASLMLEKHPQRIVAVFCRSGTAASAWVKGEIPPPQYPASAFGVPVVLNPGLKERGDARFNGAWVTSELFFDQFRAQGSPVVFAPDPFSNHDCRNSRLFAIPYFDACLRLRLPTSGITLKPLKPKAGWRGQWQTGKTHRDATNAGSIGDSWLPDQASAKAFEAYVTTGKTVDPTPPKNSPQFTRVEETSDGIVLEWEAAADFESGVRQFILYRDGAVLVRLPQNPDDRTGYAQFQGLSYHDTPVPNPPRLRFLDATLLEQTSTYSISMVNGAGLEGPRSRGTRVRGTRRAPQMAKPPTVTVLTHGESKLKPEDCRGVLIGPGVNQPDPFPGYGGFVGWESPIRLKNGTWLVGFNAGFWHASPPTPFHYSKKTLDEYVRMGMPGDIVAPTGGRAMIIRSTDEGRTWSKPETLVDTADDDRHPAFIELSDGTLLCSFFSYPGEPEDGDLAKDPKGAARVHIVRSFDGGRTWESQPRQIQTPFLYDETDGPLMRSRDGSVVVAINGRPKTGPPDQAGFFRSKDRGLTWELVSTLGTDHDMQEVTVAELPDGRWVMMARPEGDISWSSDQGRTWTKPVTFGMRLFAPSLMVLRDGTLLCLHGSYAPGHGGLRVIFSRDGGHTWLAPAKDHGFLVDNAYGYGKAMELPDGSLFITYLATGGHRTQDAKTNGIRCIRMRIRGDHSGIELLPAPNR